MTPELPASTLPALPVRRRETLEILDTALKLYRRYFWVLLGWSALVSAFSLVPVVNYFAVFAMPFLFGAVSCCVAAAVRGQSVKFSQCWAFTKPRYGALLGTLLLSYLLFLGIIFALSIAAGLVFLLGAWALSSAPQPLQIVGGIVGFLLGTVAFSIAGVVAFGWTSMVPIVVCLEDDKRSSAAIGRAFDLLKGQWRRVFGLCLILGLAVIAVFTLLGVVYALFGLGALGSIFTSSPSENAIFGLLATFGAFIGLFFLVWNPAQTLVIAVLYLDLRVRREALDLEWTAYASAPAPPSVNDSVNDPAFNSQTAAPSYLYTGAASEASLAPSDPAASLGPASFGAGKGENLDERSVERPQNAETLQNPAPETPAEPFADFSNHVSQNSSDPVVIAPNISPSEAADGSAGAVIEAPRD